MACFQNDKVLTLIDFPGIGLWIKKSSNSILHSTVSQFIYIEFPSQLSQKLLFVFISGVFWEISQALRFQKVVTKCKISFLISFKTDI